MLPLRETVPAHRPVTVRDLLTFTWGFGMRYWLSLQRRKRTEWRLSGQRADVVFRHAAGDGWFHETEGPAAGDLRPCPLYG